MLGKLKYNPDSFIVTKDRERVLEDIKTSFGVKTYNWWKQARIKNIIQELAPGIYEFWDCNAPDYFLENQKIECGEHCGFYRAKALNDSYRNTAFKRVMRKNDSSVFVSYPYGVCDNYQQILERIPSIDYIINSKKDKFCIVLNKIVKADQPAEGGWRWHKWGKYIGDKHPKYEYIYDEDDSIEYVYLFTIYRILEDNDEV